MILASGWSAKEISDAILALFAALSWTKLGFCAGVGLIAWWIYCFYRSPKKSS